MDNIADSPNIRLKKSDIIAIQTAYHLFFSDLAMGVFLFGSRIHSAKKGGDIDLYIPCTHGVDPDLVIKAEFKFKNYLYEKIGDQKIDVVIDLGNMPMAIYDVAKKDGVRLA